MKVYVGERTIDGVRVTVDESPLPAGTDVHSYTRNGFEWSYEGPEPLQLSLAILLDHLGDKAAALSLSDGFMRAVVANFGNDWEITSADIDAWLTVIAASARSAHAA